MAVAIEGFSVVVLKERIHQQLDGGESELDELAGNSQVLADDHFWRCSYMAQADAITLTEKLALRGFNVVTGPDSDVVLVSEFDQSVEPYCEWIQVTQMKGGKGVIAWLAGTTPESIIARDGWSMENGSGLTFRDHEMSELRFLRKEDGVSVYWSETENCEVFLGRTQDDPEEEFKLAATIVSDNLVDPGSPPLTGEKLDDVRAATEKLEWICREVPGWWNALFFLGKGRQAIGDLAGAHDALLKAHDVEQENERVLRELGGVCLELGRLTEAVRIGEKAAALQPDNAETLGNLACSYLIDGQLDKATSTIKAALRQAPADTVNLTVKKLIERVQTGDLPQPQKLADLTRPTPRSKSKKTSSFFRRLMFWKSPE